MRRTDTLIVGGGPAGSAAAITLAGAGLRPLLIERDAAPADALCGGFLSWRTLARLRTLGLDPDTLGGDKITCLRVFAGPRSATAELPAPALGLSRRTLDAALIALAGRSGAAIERGVAARAWDGGLVRLDDGNEIAAGRILLATGKHELRGLARPRDSDGAIGLRTRLPATPSLLAALAGTIELHLVRGGYAGLLVQDDGTANLCLAASRSRLTDVGGDPARLIDALCAESPVLGERIDQAGGTCGPVQAIAGVPYGWRARTSPPAIFRLGDQAGVVPSLAGEGIAIALASGAAAARALASGEAADRWQAGFARRLDRPFAVAGAIRRASATRAGASALVRATSLAPMLATLVAHMTRVD